MTSSQSEENATLTRSDGFADETVKVPEMAESISEGTLKQWLKKPGDFVKADEEVATIETDKIDVSVNAPKSGTITETLAEEEDTVTVGQDLFKLEPGDEPSGDASGKKEEKPKKEEKKEEKPKEEDKDEGKEKQKEEKPKDEGQDEGKKKESGSKRRGQDKKSDVEKKEVEPERPEPQQTETRQPEGRKDYGKQTQESSSDKQEKPKPFDRTERRVRRAPPRSSTPG